MVLGRQRCGGAWFSRTRERKANNGASFKGILSCIKRDIGRNLGHLTEAEWKPWKTHETKEWELTEPDTPAVGGK